VFFQWHSLDKEEQARYYELARKEKELHVQLHPGWSARDNYGTHVKKKKRKADDRSRAPEPLGTGGAGNVSGRVGGHVLDTMG